MAKAQFTDEGLASISYWTLVGAYLVKGEKNDTQTMLDAAVYDISSRKMLFRAPGLSTIKSSATLVNQSEQSRVDSVAGFTEAGQSMVKNLQEQLEQFKDKVKASPEEFKIEHKPGYTGGGSVNPAFLLLLIAIGVYGWRSSRPQKPS